MRTKTLFSLALVAVLSFGLSGCASTSSTGTSSEPAAPFSLTGEWEQSNVGDGSDSVQAATIVDDAITIYWVTDGSHALYWAGTVEVPEVPGSSFTWESVNDKTQTEGALLASSSDTKKFTYENGTLSYEATALGVTWTVKLKQTSATPAAASSGKASGGLDVKIEGATFAKDYKGLPVIVVNFAFTNNSSEPESFTWSMNAQAFQGGVELEDMVFMDGIDDSLASAEVQPGVTITVPQPFLLRDSSVVNVQVRSLMGDQVLVSQEFTVA